MAKVPCEIGPRIRAARVIKRITQAELGRRVGVNQNEMCRYEKGGRRPTDDRLKLIAAELGVTLDYLMTGREAAPASVGV